MVDARDAARAQKITRECYYTTYVPSHERDALRDAIQQALGEVRAEMQKDADACAAVAALHRKHELIGPVAECGCPSCALHWKYARPTPARREEQG